jgi:hypothetical protein
VANSFIDQCIGTGKILKETSISLESQIKQIEQEQKHLLEQLALLDDPKQLEEKQQQEKKLLENTRERIQLEQKNIQEKIITQQEQLKKIEEKIA